MADVALRVASTSERAYGDAREFDVWCAFAGTDLRARSHIGPVVVVVAGGPAELLGAASATLGTLTGASTGQVTLAGVAATTLGELTGASTGTVRLAGAVSSTLGELTCVAAGGVRLAGVASSTLGALVSTATGTVAGIPRGLTPAVLSGSSVGRTYRGRIRVTRG